MKKLLLYTLLLIFKILVHCDKLEPICPGECIKGTCEFTDNEKQTTKCVCEPGFEGDFCNLKRCELNSCHVGSCYHVVTNDGVVQDSQWCSCINTLFVGDKCDEPRIEAYENSMYVNLEDLKDVRSPCEQRCERFVGYARGKFTYEAENKQLCIQILNFLVRTSGYSVVKTPDCGNRCTKTEVCIAYKTIPLKRESNGYSLGVKYTTSDPMCVPFKKELSTNDQCGGYSTNEWCVKFSYELFNREILLKHQRLTGPWNPNYDIYGNYKYEKGCNPRCAQGVCREGNNIRKNHKYRDREIYGYGTDDAPFCDCIDGFGSTDCSKKLCKLNNCVVGPCYQVPVYDNSKSITTVDTCECPYGYNGKRCQKRYSELQCSYFCFHPDEICHYVKKDSEFVCLKFKLQHNETEIEQTCEGIFRWYNREKWTLGRKVVGVVLDFSDDLVYKYGKNRYCIPINAVLTLHKNCGTNCTQDNCDCYRNTYELKGQEMFYSYSFIKKSNKGWSTGAIAGVTIAGAVSALGLVLISYKLIKRYKRSQMNPGGEVSQMTSTSN